jgi:hypothetical protein
MLMMVYVEVLSFRFVTFFTLLLFQLKGSKTIGDYLGGLVVLNVHVHVIPVYSIPMPFE